MPKNEKVLVLNANFLPLGVISWQRAVTLAYLHQEDPSQGVEVIDYYNDDYIVSANGRKYPIPAIVRSIKYIKKKDSIPFSRKNIFIRDQMICQYCGHRFSPENLTYDHVIPRSKWKDSGTPTCFKNIVACCIPCNRKKADRTPKQAKMKLLREPVVPNASGYVLGITPWSHVPKQWILYLPQIYKELHKHT